MKGLILEIFGIDNPAISFLPSIFFTIQFALCHTCGVVPAEKHKNKKTEKEGDKEMTDKRRGHKLPLGTKAPKKIQPIPDLVSIRSN